MVEWHSNDPYLHFEEMPVNFNIILSSLFFTSLAVANQNSCLEALENKQAISLAEEHRVLQEKLSDLTDEEIQRKLYEVVGDNDISTARVLLSQIKNIHVTKKYDPLFKAIDDENEGMVMLLASDPKININAPSSSVVTPTPLSYALREDKVNVGIVWILLSHTDINVNYASSYLFSPLTRVLQLGNREIVSLLFDKHELRLGTNDKDIYLYVGKAIETGDPEIVRILLDHHQVRKKDVRKALRSMRVLGEYKDIDRDVLRVLRDYLRNR